MDDLSIRRIMELVENGQIRIPAFQRGFVWDAERVAYLMDSIYKGYPLGAVILWRTREALKSERKLGPFELPEFDPEYPLDYVLDGQQRLTSIFGVFQTTLTPAESADWIKIYFDLDAKDDAQDTRFVYLPDQEFDKSRYFPIGTFFDVTEYRKATEGLDATKLEAIDKVQAIFKEAKIPAQSIETDDRAKVAIVFERVNRLGVELDIFQLLSAWTWSEDFDLQSRFLELAEELEPYGFESVGEDSNLLLRCCAAVVAEEASPEKLIGLNGADVRGKFPEIVNGVKGAIDFLKNNFNISNVKNLPYPTLIVPLSVFFAAPDGREVRMTSEQRKALIRWFWRVCFSRRYSAAVARNIKRDVEDILKLRGGNTAALASFPVLIDDDYFSKQTFSLNTLHTRTFILMLAGKSPKSFVSGQPITLEDVLQRYNRKEFHHLFPRAHLTSLGVDQNAINALGNFVFMSSADNKVLGAVAPADYKVHINPVELEEILKSSITPHSLFTAKYESFLKARSKLLHDEAVALIK